MPSVVTEISISATKHHHGFQLVIKAFGLKERALLQRLKKIHYRQFMAFL